MVSGTIEPMGTMLAGQTADAFCVSIAHRDLLAIGLNCATGPEFMTDHLRTINEMAPTRVSCYPNAGLPTKRCNISRRRRSFAAQLERFVDHGWINLVGGCCGTTPAHIKADRGDGRRQAAEPAARRRIATYFSGVDLRGSGRGHPAADRRRAHQRHRLAGSSRTLVADEKWEEASDSAAARCKNGAQVIDVCLAADRPRRDRATSRTSTSG